MERCFVVGCGVPLTPVSQFTLFANFKGLKPGGSKWNALTLQTFTNRWWGLAVLVLIPVYTARQGNVHLLP